MKDDRWRQAAWIVGTVAAIAIVLSLLWRIPYIYTVIGAAAWAFIGHVVTLDEDLPGGWSNPDGTLPVPWGELLVKAVVLVVLIVIAAYFPILRAAGSG